MAHLLGAEALHHADAADRLLHHRGQLGLLGLPLAVWLDLRTLSERLLRLQASAREHVTCHLCTG